MPTEFEQIDVFTGGADGVHTYRIPSLIVAPGGALLAFCEARKVASSDASPTDLVVKRSLDLGLTWEPTQIVVRGQDTEAIMNPCPVSDGGVVQLFCMNAHKTEHGRHRKLLVQSSDDGRTWSEPVDITEAVGDAFVSGPGVGIRLRNGRLLIPGYANTYTKDRTRTASHTCAAFSDDHGSTWCLGKPVAYEMSNESQAVELSDGTVLVNFRIQKSDTEHPGCRGTASSIDGGETWSEPKLARSLNEAPCQAGLVRWGSSTSETSDRLLFSNPDSRPGPDGKARTRMTVRLSDDGGKTWPVARLIHAGPTAYSCPAVLPDGTIALLYECGEAWRYERIRLARFSPTWIDARAGE